MIIIIIIINIRIHLNTLELQYVFIWASCMNSPCLHVAITPPCALNKICLRLLEWGAQFDTSDLTQILKLPLVVVELKEKRILPKKYHHRAKEMKMKP